MSEIAALLLVYLAIFAAGDLCAARLGVAPLSLASWLGWRWLFGSGALAVAMMLAHALGVPFSPATIALPLVLAWLAWALLARRRGAVPPERLFVQIGRAHV